MSEAKNNLSDFDDIPQFGQMNVAIQADPDTFDNMCKMIEFAKFCHKLDSSKGYNPYQRVYQERIDLHYPNLKDFVAEESEKNKNWKDIYTRLRQLEKFLPIYQENKLSMTAYGRMTVLASLAKEGKLMEFKILNFIDPLIPNDILIIMQNAAGEGKIELLNWVYDTFNILPDSDDIDNAFLHPEVWLWAAERGVYPTQNGADYIAGTGNIEILNWLQNHNILPSSDGADRAAAKENYEVLEWLYQRDILPTRRAANTAKLNNKIELLNWLAERGVQSSARRLFPE